MMFHVARTAKPSSKSYIAMVKAVGRRQQLGSLKAALQKALAMLGNSLHRTSN